VNREENEIPAARKKKSILIGLSLTILVLATFYPVRQFDFITYDDRVYVTGNERVQEGLSRKGLVWAFCATEAGFWHPLTWLSLMIDSHLYRLNPSGYHWTNLLLHLAVTLSIFLVLRSMTGAVWRSAFVAALFAVHPLNVEPVSWVAARKDVLSAFFWILTLAAYGYYAKGPALSRYGIVVAVFSLGLMAKPALVTIPFILILMDFWPLGRLRWEKRVRPAQPSPAFCAETINLPRAFAEKIPLIVLSVLVGLVTVYSEQKIGALKSLDAYPLDVRMTNALVSYLLYIGKLLWPVNLAVHYPHPGAWGLGTVAGTAVALIGISFFALRRLFASPYLAVGWLWYLTALLPVIGFIQIGSHAMADRYAYIPSIGLFIMISWGSAELVSLRPKIRGVLVAAAVISVLLLAVVSSRQLQHWENAVTVFRRAVSVAPENALAQNNLGAALARRGDAAGALEHYRQALRIQPRYPEAFFNMGAALADLGRFEEALSYYRRVLEEKPDCAEGYNNIGVVLASQGRFAEAAERFRQALSIRPDYVDARNNYERALKSLP